MQENGTAKAEFKGCHEDADGKLICDQCGKSAVKFVAHMDGRDKIMNVYECENGHPLMVETERYKNSKKYWR